MYKTVEAINDKVKISDIISSYTKLQKKGREHTGLCPFHREKTPSFSVSDEKGLYHCYGCGESGNVYTFLKKQKGFSFRETVHYLCDLLRIPYPDENTQHVKDPYYSILRDAVDYFKSHINQVSEYLKKRNVTAYTTYELGYCPRDPQDLMKQLKKDYKNADLEKAGLFRKNGRFVFEDRLIFPIKNEGGKVIALAGRALNDNIKPKYINTSENEHFQKRDILYGLYEARKNNPIIVVEGYLDVIMLHQAGFPHAVCVMGTALQKKQLEDLWKHQREVICCFDGDHAGYKALMKAVEIGLPAIDENKVLSFIVLPDGEDPDSFVQKDPSGFKKLYEKPMPFARLLWQFICKSYDITRPEDFLKIRSSIFEYTKKIVNPLLRKQYIGSLFDLLYSNRKKRNKQNSILPLPLEKNSKLLEQILLALLIKHPILLSEVHENLGRISFSDPLLDQVRRSILDAFFANQEWPKQDGWMGEYEELHLIAPFIDSFEDARCGFWDVFHTLIQKEAQSEVSQDCYWEKLRGIKAHLVKGDIYGG